MEVLQQTFNFLKYIHIRSIRLVGN